MEAEQESSSPEGPASLRDALTQAFEEASETTEPVVNDDPPTENEAKLDASEDDEAELPESSEEETLQSDSQDDGEEVILAPEHWSDEDKATFTGLPRDAQDYLLKREKQYEQGIQSKVEEFKPIRDAFGGYRDMLKMRGVDEATAIRSWVAAQSMLDQDPVSGLKMLMNQYGPEVAKQVAQGFIDNAEETGTEYTDPEIASLRQQLNDQKQQQSDIERRYAQIQQQEAAQKVQQFMDAKDDDGNLLHPHFEKVQEDMRALISAGSATDLESAYQKAVWLSPEVRAELVESEKAAARKEAERKRQEAAKKAAKTAKAVNGKSSKPPPPSKSATLRDDLKTAYEQSLRGEL